MHISPLNMAYDIVCPKCKTQQRTFIKLSDGADIRQDYSKLSYSLPVGTPYILCINRWGCKHIITGDELDEVTTFRVKYPSDIRILKQAQLI